MTQSNHHPPASETTLISTARQRELIEHVTHLASRRAKEELEVRARFIARESSIGQRHEQLTDQEISEFERTHAKLVTEYQDSREKIFRHYENEGHGLWQEENQQAEAIKTLYQEHVEQGKELFNARSQKLLEQYRAQETAPKQEYEHFKHACEVRAGEIYKLLAATEEVVKRRTPWPTLPPDAPAPMVALSPQENIERFNRAMHQGKQLLYVLEHQPAARFIEEGWPWLLLIFGLILLPYPIYLLLGSFGWIVVVATVLVLSGAIAFGARLLARPLAKTQTLRVLPQMLSVLAEAKASLAAALQAAHQVAENTHKQLTQRYEQNLAHLTAEHEKQLAAANEELAARLKQVADQMRQRRLRLESSCEQQLRQLEGKHPRLIDDLEANFEKKLVSLAGDYRRQRAHNRHQFENDSKALVEQWTHGVNKFVAAAAEMNRYCQEVSPGWSQLTLPRTTAPTGDIAALPLGSYQFSLADLQNGQPRKEHWQLPCEKLELPLVMSYPDSPSLLIEAEGEGREAASRVMQNAMLRLLTTFPPGKVRFTVLDPVGLGQNFSAFMHLADYDERLVNNRIWTEANHVNQRLADLTEHMENVIQKYLRNEFASIQEYNQQAGEVAEAFQILVVANFPANFSDEAARRLVSIATSGPRCGVYTLISVDTKLKLPRQFELRDLEGQASTLTWNDDQQRFTWKYPDLRHLPLKLDEPPSDDRVTDLIRIVGKQAKEASRVEVPFESVLPAPDRWWQADSRAELEVPLGRAGAKKLQYMRLGKGTSQHVLISGKTGSGKSNLLNAIITNLACYYSPQELQFYLIDFKKGVEFKAYASLRLPHARVIAIESEREFGISVLERLDLELKQRGDMFRQQGVQDLKGYRNAKPDAVLPRILLVIDEFQEFFTNDDRISHDSALLLDRLVRQGRAFGIHVLLGSQTLAGAYSLARSTIGQMAVRIALQCSESDAHLILSEDNTAARLLNRPGEAIYNDANGMFEGNHPFQVVWLSDHQRESYLQRIAALAEQNAASLPTPIVFEGNVAASPAENDLLRALLAQPPVELVLSPRAWLGAAVAIKDPTDATFRRQGGTNLLIVGSQEDLALGIVSNAMISLAAQAPCDAEPSHSALPTFLILDGTRPESPDAGTLRRIATQLQFSAKVAGPRDAADIIRKLAEEVDRRVAEGDQNAEPHFLVLFNIARFRDLKRGDDFGLASFGDDDAGPSAEKQLATILREGPTHGIHTMIWCDSYNNVNRWLERSTLREFDLRVLFQMSANDSANLMDSPIASKLGTHMAILYSEEQGRAEKFRPYAIPTDAWLAKIAETRQLTEKS